MRSPAFTTILGNKENQMVNVHMPLLFMVVVTMVQANVPLTETLQYWLRETLNQERNVTGVTTVGRCFLNRCIWHFTVVFMPAGNLTVALTAERYFIKKEI